MKKNVILIVLPLIIYSCEKESCNCCTDENFIESDWIQEIKSNQVENSDIIYSNMELFELNNLFYIYFHSVTLNYKISDILYDCKGNISNELDLKSYEDCEIFSKEALKIKNLWEYTNSDCFCCSQGQIEESEWLTQLIEDIQNDSDIVEATINLYKWENMYCIYLVLSYLNLYDWPNSFLDCEGTLISHVGGILPPHCGYSIFSNSQKLSTIWEK